MIRFSIGYTLQNPQKWHQPWNELYEAVLEQAVLAEELGFDRISLSEHHFVDDGYLPSAIPIAAAIAARTKYIGIGTSIIILPFYHPILLAEQCSLVDILSNGRLSIGIGAGYKVDEFEGFGTPKNRRRTLMEEGLQILTKCWTEEEFSFKGEHYDIKNVRCTPKPLQKPHPPVWIGARSDAATTRAARMGFHLMPLRGRRQHQLYQDKLREFGRDPADFRINRTWNCYVLGANEDSSVVHADLLEQHIYRMELYHKWLSSAADDPRDVQLAQQEPVKGHPWFVGTAEECVKSLEAHVERFPGTTDISMWMSPIGRDPRQYNPALERFAKQVIPHFKG